MDRREHASDRGRRFGCMAVPGQRRPIHPLVATIASPVEHSEVAAGGGARNGTRHGDAAGMRRHFDAQGIIYILDWFAPDLLDRKATLECCESPHDVVTAPAAGGAFDRHDGRTEAEGGRELRRSRCFHNLTTDCTNASDTMATALPLNQRRRRIVLAHASISFRITDRSRQR
jgi:hypothetical protein